MLHPGRFRDPAHHTRSDERFLRNQRQETGARFISLGGGESVKPGVSDPRAAVLSALPVVALAGSSRKFGLVCLNARLVPVRVRLRDIRKRQTASDRIAAIVAALDEVADHLAPETLVLERDPRQQRGLDPGRSKVVEWAEDRGLQVRYLSAADACAKIAGTANTFAAAERLAARYAPLAERVLDGNGRLLRGHDRWRDVRPLVVAFALAHAFAANAVTTAFGGSISSPARTHPTPYDPRDSRPA